MSQQPQTVIAGNLAEEPTLRWTRSGTAVANLTIIHNPRRFDRERNDWVDGTPVSVPATVWRAQAERVTETFRRGDRVLAAGTLVTNAWTTEDGQKRSRLELEIDEIAASVLYATATITKVSRGQAGRPTDAPADEGTDGHEQS